MLILEIFFFGHILQIRIGTLVFSMCKITYGCIVLGKVAEVAYVCSGCGQCRCGGCVQLCNRLCVD